MMKWRRGFLVLAAAAVAACARAREGSDSTTAAAPDSTTRAAAPDSTTRAAPSSDVTRLEAEARALAKPGGCEQASQCRTAPVGSKPCGGPRTYLVYCPRTTDEGALLRKLDELRRAEDARNRKEGMMSDCSLTPEPKVDVIGGSCRAGADPRVVPL
jgi:hypothetical protein